MSLQAHSDAAWNELVGQQVRQHARLWFRLAYDILHDAHAAEDVCQQALMRGWSNRDRLRDPKLLRAWLARTVINESLQMLRRGRSERRVLDERSQQTPLVALPNDPMAAREAVVMGLEGLPEPVRIVVALRIMEGLSGNEVKDLLGYSASQVSRMLHEGLEQLRTTLGSEQLVVKKDGQHDVQ